MKSERFYRFIENSRKIHGYKYEYLEYTNMRTPIKISYNGKIYYQSPVKHLMGRCIEKSTDKMSQSDFIKKCNEVWNNRFDYSNTVYDGALKNIHFKDLHTKIEYSQRAKSHLDGVDPFNPWNTDFFIAKSIEKYGDDIYDYSLTEYKGYHTKLKLILKETNEVFEQSPNNHFNYIPEKIKKRDTKSFIFESNIIHDFKYKYDKVDYIKCISKVIITCPIHGDFEQTPNSHLGGSGCASCNESFGEKKIARYLNNKSIEYIRQKRFDDCRNIQSLPFDFYIPLMRTTIEFNSKQHYEPSPFFGGIEAYEKLKTNDKIKEDYCEDNYINLIRIKYDQVDKINEILWENLKIFIKK